MKIKHGAKKRQFKNIRWKGDNSYRLTVLAWNCYIYLWINVPYTSFPRALWLLLFILYHHNVFFLNHHNSLFNVSMMLSMALTLLLRTYYDTFSVFFFSFIFAFQIVRFFILFVFQNINWNSRIKFNKSPVAQDH